MSHPPLPMSHPSLRMVAFDIDGVVHRGATLLPGAHEALIDVLRRGLLLRYVTNNSAQHRSEVAARLAGFGLPAEPEYILTSGAATADWLRERLEPKARVVVVGGEGLVRELIEVGLDARHGLGFLADAAAPAAAAPGADAAARRGAAAAAATKTAGARVGASTDAVPPLPGSAQAEAAMIRAIEALALDPPAAMVVGLDRTFSYYTLALAQAAVMAGALFVATNADATFPVEGRLLPGGGSLVAAVVTAGGRQPVVIGKPEQEMAHRLAESAGVAPEGVLFVGDRLDTDILWARRAGMQSALVYSGVTQPSDVARLQAAESVDELPDFIMDDLRGLPQLLDRLLG